MVRKLAYVPNIRYYSRTRTQTEKSVSAWAELLPDSNKTLKTVPSPTKPSRSPKKEAKSPAGRRIQRVVIPDSDDEDIVVDSPRSVSNLHIYGIIMPFIVLK